jgi:hypothetical protein
MVDVSALVSASTGDLLVQLSIEASIPSPDIHIALRNALINKSDFVNELLVLNRNYEQRLYAAFAAKSNLGFLADIDPINLIIDTSDQGASMRQLPFASYRCGFAETQLLAAPPAGQLRHLLTQNLDAERLPRLRIVTPTALNKAVEVHFRDQRVRDAVHSYATAHPEHSSRITLKGWQAWFFGFLFGSAPAMFFLFPATSLITLHVVTWVFFFSCVAL